MPIRIRMPHKYGRIPLSWECNETVDGVILYSNFRFNGKGKKRATSNSLGFPFVGKETKHPFRVDILIQLFANINHD